MYEKCYEHIELHKAFIDINQAFDSLKRSTIIQALKEMQLPGKFVRLVSMLTQHTKAKIKLNNEYTEQIDVKTANKQGDPLSTKLLNTVMEMLMRKLEIRGNITSLRIRRRCCAGDKN